MQPKHCLTSCLIISLITSPMLLILFTWQSPPSPQSPQPPPSSDHNNPKPTIHNTFPVFSPILNPTRHRDFVFQIPQSPIAVLFLAHGCGRTAGVFWDPHSGCPTCLGLPEERAFVITALELGFAVIAISSGRVCWDVKEDVENVEGILREWIARNGLEMLPVVGLGGWFVSQFAMRFRFDAIVLMVAEGRYGADLMLPYYPPVMFVHMVKDVARAKQIRVDMAVLMASGVPVTEYLCVELPILPDWFSRRIPYIGNATSGKMVKALVASGCLTEGKLLKNDARWFDWSLAFEENDVSVPAELRAHVEEELNVAFAFHEFSSLAASEVFQWFEFHIHQARNFTKIPAS